MDHPIHPDRAPSTWRARSSSYCSVTYVLSLILIGPAPTLYGIQIQSGDGTTHPLQCEGSSSARGGRHLHSLYSTPMSGLG